MNTPVATLLTVMLLAYGISASSPAGAETITITERHVMLKSEINKAEKSGELTKKEADRLRDKNADILSKEVRMKDKNGGKLSYKNITTIEKDLNKLSVEINKKQLAKRVD